MINSSMSNIKIPNAFDLLSISDQVCDLSSKFFKLLHTNCHHNLFILSSLNLDDNLWPKHFVQVVRGQHHINLPLTGGVVKSTGLAVH